MQKSRKNIFFESHKIPSKVVQLTSIFTPIVVPHKEIPGERNGRNVDDEQVPFQIHRLAFRVR